MGCGSSEGANGGATSDRHLIEALQGTDGTGPGPVDCWTVRQVVDALEEMGPQAKVAVPALTSLLEHQRWGIRRAAAEALMKIDSEAAHKLDLH